MRQPFSDRRAALHCRHYSYALLVIVRFQDAQIVSSFIVAAIYATDYSSIRLAEFSLPGWLIFQFQTITISFRFRHAAVSIFSFIFRCAITDFQVLSLSIAQ